MSEPSQFSFCNTPAKSFRCQWTDKDAWTVIQWHDFITTTAQTFDVESEIFFSRERWRERERNRAKDKRHRTVEWTSEWKRKLYRISFWYQQFDDQCTLKLHLCCYARIKKALKKAHTYTKYSESPDIIADVYISIAADSKHTCASNSVELKLVKANVFCLHAKMFASFRNFRYQFLNFLQIMLVHR